MPVRIFPCSVNLPARLADELAGRATRDFSDVGVAVPSHRLANYVRLALAQRVNACLPPRLGTLDELAGLVASPPRRQRISKIERSLLLTELLAPHRFQYLRRGMEVDVARFFDELVAQDLLPSVFQEIRELLSRDVFRDERHLERLQQQAAELESLHSAYQVFLDEHSWTDSVRDVAVRVKSLFQGPPFTERTALRHIYLIGFADATRVQKMFVKHLLSQCGAQFWTHGEAAFLSAQIESADDWRRSLNPFAALVELLGAIGEKAITVAKPDAEPPGANSEILKAAYFVPDDSAGQFSVATGAAIHLHEAATPLAEVKAAAALIRRLVHEQEVAPHGIVLVVPDEQVYGRLVWSVFAEAGIQTNNSLGQPLLRTRAGQWLHLLLMLVEENWRFADLISFLYHPFTEMWMRVLVPQVSASAIQRLVEDCLLDEEIARGQSRILQAVERIKEGEPQARAASTNVLAALRDVLVPLAAEANDGRLTMRQWTERLLQVLEQTEFLRWIAMTGGGAFNLDGQASQIIISTLQEVLRAGELFQQSLGFGEFFRLLNQELFAAIVRPVGEPHAGVQVMGLLESRAVPAAVCLVLGNNEGSFPAALGRELFLEEPLRAQIGLMTHQKAELLQDMNFYRLVAGAPAVHLFYARSYYETRRLRSRCLERLLVLNEWHPGAVRLQRESGRLFESDFMLEPGALDACESLRPRLHLLESRMEQRHDLRGAFCGNRAQLSTYFSATPLQMLFHCPYRFLLHTKHIDKRELPADRADSLVLGKWLHRVLQVFFQGITDASIPLAAADEDLRKPWTAAITPALREAAADRLQRLGRVLMTSHEGQEHLYYHMLCVGWPAFVEAEIGRGTAVFRPEYFEFKIEDVLATALLIGSHQVSVRGRVDRIFATESEIRLIDYKLSGSSASDRSILAADEPQLPLYAFALHKSELFPIAAKWTGEFWSIRRGESKSVLAKEPQGLAAGFNNLLHRWQERLDQLSSGAPFRAEETPYCRHCVYAGVCRREELFYVNQERGKPVVSSQKPEVRIQKPTTAQ